MNQSQQTTGIGPAPSSGTEAEEAAPAAASGLEQEEAAPAVAAGSAVAVGPAPAGLDMEEEEAVPAVLLDLTNKKEEAGPAVAAAAGRSTAQLRFYALPTRPTSSARRKAGSRAC